MAEFEDIEPTPGDNGNTFEWLLDINTGTRETPVWTNLPDITGVNPTGAPKLKDVTTYANKGNTAQRKVGEDFTFAFAVLGIRDDTGEFQAADIALIEAADAIGEDNVVGYRYYHATSPSLAYEGTAAVQWNRQNTGNDDPEFFAFTLTGQGDRARITNPAIPES